MKKKTGKMLAGLIAVIVMAVIGAVIYKMRQ